MKYILIYKCGPFGGTMPPKKTATIEELEKFIEKQNIAKGEILYLGEYKPLEYKIKLENRGK